MKVAWMMAGIALIFFAAWLYCLDLMLFLRREQKRFSSFTDPKTQFDELEKKQKKTGHPQKKNYYLYLICMLWIAQDQRDRAQRLLPFLRKDALLGIDPKKL